MEADERTHASKTLDPHLLRTSVAVDKESPGDRRGLSSIVTGF